MSVRLGAPQGSEEWVKARLGIPTASRFGELLTPAKLQPTKGTRRDAYACELIFERIAGLPARDELSQWMERGWELEEEAAEAYALLTDHVVEETGLWLTDDHEVGASPDRLVGIDGLVEIKCPAGKKHVEYLLGISRVEEEYRSQVQGQLWVTEREWCDVVSYCPGMPLHLVTVEPDPVWREAWEIALADFRERIKELVGIARETGALPELIGGAA